MKTSTAIIAVAALFGFGYYVGKQAMKNRKPEADAVSGGSEESYGDKVRKASMFAVGTLRTTADKISEGIQQVKSGNMIQKGEQTVEQVKETTEELKDEIKDLKNLVTSINTTPADVPESSDLEDEVDLFGGVDERVFELDEEKL